MSRPGGRAILTGLHSIYQWRQADRRAARRSFTYPYLDVLVRIAEGVERLSPRPVAGGFPPGPLVGPPPEPRRLYDLAGSYVMTAVPPTDMIGFPLEVPGCRSSCPCGVDYGDGEETR